MKKRSNCVPGTQTTSTEDVFTVVCGVDFPGNDMFITPAVSITQCLEFCAGYHPLCMSLSLSSSPVAYFPNSILWGDPSFPV